MAKLRTLEISLAGKITENTLYPWTQRKSSRKTTKSQMQNLIPRIAEIKTRFGHTCERCEGSKEGRADLMNVRRCLEAGLIKRKGNRIEVCI
jgi:hypothetical protein